MEFEIKQAIKHRLEKKAGLVGDEMESGWEAAKNVGGAAGAPLWAGARAVNPIYLANTAAKSAKYGLVGGLAGGAAGAAGGGYLGYKLGKDLPLSVKLALMLGGGAIGGIGGAHIGGAAGAGIGATVHNPWRTYKKKKQLKQVLYG